MAICKDTPRGLGKEQSKVRVIAVYRMLSEGKVLSCATIAKRLYAQYGIVCDRKTIYRDVWAVNRIMPIEVVPGANGGYRRMEV